MLEKKSNLKRMRAIFSFVMFFAFCIFCGRNAQETNIDDSNVIYDTLKNFITNLHNNSQAKQDSNLYLPPAETEFLLFKQAITELLKGNFNINNMLSSLNYKLAYLYDTTYNSRFVIVYEKSPNKYYDGIFIFNFSNSRDYIIEVPHSFYDLYTWSEGVDVMCETKAKALFINQAHRCANTTLSTCDGSTTVCDINSTNFRISDIAHTPYSFFQSSHEAVIDFSTSSITFQLHGFGSWTEGNPVAYISDGTTIVNASTNYITNKLKTLLADELTLSTSETYSVASCNDSIGGTLCAETNVQGRYANDSKINPCGVSASTASGRFVHIEQSLDLRKPDGRINRTFLINAMIHLME